MSGSRTIIGDDDRLDNVHPGEVLREDFLIGSDVPAADVASGAKITLAHLTDILNERSAIDAETDLLLARYLGMSDGFFLRLQNAYDLEEARHARGQDLDSIVPRAA